MDAEVLNSSESEVKLSIKGSDIGTLYIIQHEILQKDNVDFAGVIVKHPLTKECWMQVSGGSGPADAITNAADAAIENVEQLKSLFGSIEDN